MITSAKSAVRQKSTERAGGPYTGHEWGTASSSMSSSTSPSVMGFTPTLAQTIACKIIIVGVRRKILCCFFWQVLWRHTGFLFCGCQETGSKALLCICNSIKHGLIMGHHLATPVLTMLIELNKITDMWALAIWTQIFMLAWQALYPLNLLISKVIYSWSQSLNGRKISYNYECC